MKRIIFILCAVFTTYSFAENDAESSQSMCKTLEVMAETTQTLRQRGMKASEITDNLLEVSANFPAVFKKRADNTTDKIKAEKIIYFGNKYREVLDNYVLILVQQAFEVPIQSKKEMKKKVIEEFSNEHYLSCLLKASETNLKLE
ncbi:TPA: hypothetical protein MW256_003617 [Acinetobacter baumannii]|nr:hypothetical protein [Acinetobacter baumannii]